MHTSAYFYHLQVCKYFDQLMHSIQCINYPYGLSSFTVERVTGLFDGTESLEIYSNTCVSSGVFDLLNFNKLLLFDLNAFPTATPTLPVHDMICCSRPRITFSIFHSVL